MRVYVEGYGDNDPSKKQNPGKMSWDTLRYVLVNIWNHPRPSETLFGIGDVDRGVHHTPKCSSLVHLGP